jgi:hypothetical protein
MKPQKVVSESEIEDYLRDQIKAIGGKAYKWVSPGNRGVPDRIIVLPKGYVLFIELKAPGKKSSAQQTKKQKELRNLGQYVDVIDTKEGVNEFVDYCKKVLQL